MTRRLGILAALAAAVTVTACGSSEPAVEPEAAKATIEQAAQVKLTSDTVPSDAHEQGLDASYSNASTAAQDKQVIGLFVVKDAGFAKRVTEQVRQSAPKTAKLLVGRNVLVVYAPAGADRSAAVERAVKAL